MDQRFLQVFKNGKVWFEFPSENELNVREMLIKQNIDRVCDIKPKVDQSIIVKKSIKNQDKLIDLSKTETK